MPVSANNASFWLWEGNGAAKSDKHVSYLWQIKIEPSQDWWKKKTVAVVHYDFNQIQWLS